MKSYLLTNADDVTAVRLNRIKPKFVYLTQTELKLNDELIKKLNDELIKKLNEIIHG